MIRGDELAINYAGGLPAAMQRAIDLSDWIQASLHEEATVADERRSIVTIALASLSLEHREAMLALIQLNARATFMAVARPQLEAYIRALWAHQLADDTELDRFLKGTYDPSIPRSLQKLGKKAAPQGSVFTALKMHYELLCDYAHGGGRQVNRWLHRDQVGPRYSDFQLIEILHFANVIGVLAGAARNVVSGHSDSAFDAKLSELLA